MAFQTPITIKEAIKNIDKKEYYLPAIQREFVWKPEQIEKLFDSLLRGYPINSFLFWKVEKENIQNYKFYEFLRDYHEKESTHNPEANLSGENNIIAILDGQQRLTSLYIALKGTYAYKIPKLRWENPKAFPSRKLYLNLLDKSKDNDLIYNFKFLTDEECKERSDTVFWFPVEEILKMSKQHEVNTYLLKNNLMNGSDPERSVFANETLFQLYSAINESLIINYYLLQEEDLNKVLDIFVRVNNGGTKLNHSDLLLSMASAQWEELDARKEINKCVDDTNKIGAGFNIDKDFVMRTCLVICEIGDFSFKVENFTAEKMKKIESKWEYIQDSIELSFQLLAQLGYSRDTITSYTAISIIAYYIYKIGMPQTFVTSSNFMEDRKKIQKFLAIVMLKHTFGGQIQKAITNMCAVISDKAPEKHFPLEEIIEKQKGEDKPLTFDDADIANILDYKYGNALTYSILALLYPSLDFKNKFHQDHIHPKSKINSKRKLEKLGLSNDDIDFYLDNYDTISNLQLLEGTINEEKSNEYFDSWFLKNYTTEVDQKDYKTKHYIPDCSLDIMNFREFITKRNELLTKKLKEIL